MVVVLKNGISFAIAAGARANPVRAMALSLIRKN